MDRFSSREESLQAGRAFRAGSLARRKGRLPVHNPYKETSLARRLWNAGWADMDMVIISEGNPETRP